MPKVLTYEEQLEKGMLLFYKNYKKAWDTLNKIALKYKCNFKAFNLYSKIKDSNEKRNYILNTFESIVYYEIMEIYRMYLSNLESEIYIRKPNKLFTEIDLKLKRKYNESKEKEYAEYSFKRALKKVNFEYNKFLKILENNKI